MQSFIVCEGTACVDCKEPLCKKCALDCPESYGEHFACSECLVAHMRKEHKNSSEEDRNEAIGIALGQIERHEDECGDV